MLLLYKSINFILSSLLTILLSHVYCIIHSISFKNALQLINISHFTIPEEHATIPISSPLLPIITQPIFSQGNFQHPPAKITLRFTTTYTLSLPNPPHHRAPNFTLATAIVVFAFLFSVVLAPGTFTNLFNGTSLKKVHRFILAAVKGKAKVYNFFFLS